ncbi:MAG: NIP7 pre-PUA domain-containing protein [Caldisphaera sp.]|jgi:60S ribosome subunit biogenesis protein NIP7|nr:hypothetical protein [Caldisphaera sp.]PMP61056.1 MAG: hypothetical protein C0201_00680 [Caldisphaera sp.]PMP88592.1 MAG: hypothetical protein C0172_02320 [Caldisphaera sp.]
MQAKEAPRLRDLSEKELHIIKEFTDSLGIKIESILNNPKILIVKGAKFNDVFDFPIYFNGLIDDIKSIYSGGYYLGYIKKEKFHPGIPLANRISRLCKIIDCIIIDDTGEKIFLYGKNVNQNHLIKFSKGLKVVVNANYESLGWGIGKVINGKKEIKIVEPLKDLGWYLRRGG